jgi:hypothetical protein
LQLVIAACWCIVIYLDLIATGCVDLSWRRFY